MTSSWKARPGGSGGDENKFPGEISGGMRNAGLARSLVLDPQIILCDEPDSVLTRSAPPTCPSC